MTSGDRSIRSEHPVGERVVTISPRWRLVAGLLVLFLFAAVLIGLWPRQTGDVAAEPPLSTQPSTTTEAVAKHGPSQEKLMSVVLRHVCYDLVPSESEESSSCSTAIESTAYPLPAQ